MMIADSLRQFAVGQITLFYLIIETRFGRLSKANAV